MKIDGNRPAPDADALRRAEEARKAQRQQATRVAADKADAAQAGTDRVEVSADAKLVTSALKAAQEAPEVRQALVDRMREALAAGKVGKDSRKLADKLLDSLLNK